MTVIVTFYNQQQWVDQALDSVDAQTEGHVQLLIADDGSTDGTRERIDAWQRGHDGRGTSVFAPDNRGLPALLNRCVPLIQGRFVVVLNGDDWFDSTRLESQAEALDRLPIETGLVYSDLRVVDVDGNPTGEVFPPPDQGRPEGQLLHRMISGPLFGMPCVMFRRSVLDSIGLWDETLIADDFDFLLRAAAAGFEFAYVQAVETNYRQYGTSLTGSRSMALADGRISSLLKLRGRDDMTDRVIDRRVEGLAIALHSGGYDRQATRRRLRAVMRHSPSRRALRSTIESHLGIRPGRLSPHHWVRRSTKLD